MLFSVCYKYKELLKKTIFLKEIKIMKMTKGMKIFWAFAIVGILFYGVTYAFDLRLSPDRGKMEGDFTEKDIVLAVHTMENIDFGDSPEEVSDKLFGPVDEQFFDYVLKDFSEGFDHVVYNGKPKNYASICSYSQKKKFPLNTLFAEFYDGELVSVTMNLAGQYSMDTTGKTVLDRQNAVMSEIGDVVEKLGYVKKTSIPYYLYESDQEVYSDYTVFDPITIRSRWTDIWNRMDVGMDDQFAWSAYDNFYNGYVYFVDEGMPGVNNIEYYTNPGGNKVIAVIADDVFFPLKSFDYDKYISENARFAPVTVVCYDIEKFNAAKEDGGVVVYNSFTSANNIEMYKEMNEIGTEEFFEKYYGKNR